MRFVLLHSPLVAPGCWARLTPLLQARGHDVIVPDFTTAIRGAAPYYSCLVEIAATAIGAARDDVALVAHSGAGALVPAIAQRVPAKAAIFLDGLLPHPGKAWFDTAPPALNARIRSLAREGMLPPWHRWWPEAALRALLPAPGQFEAFAAELQPLPLAYFDEIAPDIALTTPCAYLQIGPLNGAEADWAAAQGWPVTRRDLHHLAMLTHPDTVADEIERLATEL